MADMLVFVLHFEDRAAVQRAFAVTSDDAVVETATVEPEERRIRFLASRIDGDRVVERIYEKGGLTWCARHPWGSSRGDSG